MDWKRAVHRTLLWCAAVFLMLVFILFLVKVFQATGLAWGESLALIAISYIIWDRTRSLLRESTGDGGAAERKAKRLDGVMVRLQELERATGHRPNPGPPLDNVVPPPGGSCAIPPQHREMNR